MGSSAERLLFDTSAAVALVTERHSAHTQVMRRAAGHRRGLAGHAYFETYSVLTRQPIPGRLSGADAESVIAHNFPDTHHLSVTAAEGLLRELAHARIVGAAIYDALIGAAAREADALLLSLDRRATEVYRAIGARFELI